MTSSCADENPLAPSSRWKSFGASASVSPCMISAISELVSTGMIAAISPDRFEASPRAVRSGV